MIATSLRITAVEDAKGRVKIRLKLIGTKAKSPTARECETVEHAVHFAALKIHTCRRMLQRQSETRPAQQPLRDAIGGAH